MYHKWIATCNMKDASEYHFINFVIMTCYLAVKECHSPLAKMAGGLAHRLPSVQLTRWTPPPACQRQCPNTRYPYCATRLMSVSRCIGRPRRRVGAMLAVGRDGRGDLSPVRRYRYRHQRTRDVVPVFAECPQKRTDGGAR